MSRADLAEDLAAELGKFRDNLAAVLPDDGDELARDLARLPMRTIRGLLDVLSVLRSQDERLFEAYIDWMMNDPGGEDLADHITSRLGYSAWLDKVERRRAVGPAR